MRGGRRFAEKPKWRQPTFIRLLALRLCRDYGAWEGNAMRSFLTAMAGAVVLSGCATSTGILPAGPDTYTISEKFAPIRGGGDEAEPYQWRFLNIELSSLVGRLAGSFGDRHLNVTV